MSDRRARSRKLCQILAKHVSALASPGLGQWGPAWEIVEEVSNEFFDALIEWERTGSEAAMDRAKTLSLQVRDAWLEAERQYRESGQDATREEVRT